MQITKAKRIMIFGRPGSGKSTFAHELHNTTKIPLYHLDKYFFTKNWEKRDYAEFMAMQIEIVNKDSWIVDGNCTQSLETRYSHADLCLYFNVNKFVCLWRVCKRLLQKRDHIDDRAEDCAERVSWHFFKYLWTFEDRVKDKIAAMRANFPHVQFIECMTNKQIKNIINSIQNK